MERAPALVDMWVTPLPAPAKTSALFVSQRMPAAGSRRPPLCNGKSDQPRPNDPPLQEQTEFKLLSSIVYVISVTVDYSLCRIGSMDSAEKGQVHGMPETGCSLSLRLHFKNIISSKGRKHL